MTKSELKTGMIVELKNGNEYYVFVDAETGGYSRDVLVATDGSNSWLELRNFDKDLTHISFPDFNVVKIMTVCHPYALVRPNYHREYREVIYPKK